MSPFTFSIGACTAQAAHLQRVRPRPQARRHPAQGAARGGNTRLKAVGHRVYTLNARPPGGAGRMFKVLLCCWGDSDVRLRAVAYAERRVA